MIRNLTIAASLYLACLLAGCSSRRQSSPPGNPVLPAPQQEVSASTPQAASSPPGVHFREVGLEAGLNYHWSIPGKRPLNILQTIGNGCAFLDFDNDGNLDILLVGPKLGLFKGDGKGHFSDVSKAAGLTALTGHFLGCTVGDYDNDGFDDVYVSGWRTGILLHNEGGNAFADVTRSVGMKPQPWSTSCGFADLDGDGFLDLYVANYISFDPTTDILLCPFHGVLSGCGPVGYDAAHGVLYHNVDGKRFVDVTKASGVIGQGKGLGVAFARYEHNGRLSFAVANDLMPGDLFRSLGNGKFENAGARSGTALDSEGDQHAGMGIDWGDYDNDGSPDLFVTTFSKEIKTLYRNHGNGVFSIVSPQIGIDEPTLPFVGWGCKFFDADNDGWLDILMATGHVQDNIRRFEKLTYREPVLLLRNLGKSPVKFEDATRSSGISHIPPIVGRGLAVGDYDNDGRVDAIVVDSEGRPMLIHNESGTDNNWIGFRLRGVGRSNSNGFGAVIRVVTNGDKRYRQCFPSGSYLSASDSRVEFGLGKGKPDIVTVWWPDGRVDSWTDLKPGEYHTLKEVDRK